VVRAPARDATRQARRLHIGIDVLVLCP
jgi:hypothetical protein